MRNLKTVGALFAAFMLFAYVAPETQAQSRSQSLVPTTTIAGAQTVVTDPVLTPQGLRNVSVQSKLVYAAGGTTLKVYLQTSLDGGASWIDVAAHAFTTASATKVSAVRGDVALAAAYVPTDGTLTDDTIKDGLLGDRWRVKYVVAGTYTGATTLTVNVVVN